MIIKHVNGVLTQIDTEKSEIKLERVKQLEGQLGKYVESIYHNDLLIEIR